jgi:hypothetical protein
MPHLSKLEEEMEGKNVASVASIQKASRLKEAFCFIVRCEKADAVRALRTSPRRR